MKTNAILVCPNCYGIPQCPTDTHCPHCLKLYSEFMFVSRKQEEGWKAESLSDEYGFVTYQRPLSAFGLPLIYESDLSRMAANLGLLSMLYAGSIEQPVPMPTIGEGDEILPFEK